MKNLTSICEIEGIYIESNNTETFVGTDKFSIPWLMLQQFFGFHHYNSKILKLDGIMFPIYRFAFEIWKVCPRWFCLRCARDVPEMYLGVPQVVLPEVCPRCAFCPRCTRGVPLVCSGLCPRCARGVPQMCIGGLPSYLSVLYQPCDVQNHFQDLKRVTKGGNLIIKLT
jgi:hypothetical protein